MHYGKMTSLLFSPMAGMTPVPFWILCIKYYTLFALLQSASYTLLDALYIAIYTSELHAC